MKYFVGFCVLLVTVSAARADTVYLQNGEKVKGKILRTTEFSVEIDPDGEIPYDVIRKANINKIDYDDGRAESIIFNKSKNEFKSAGIKTHDGFFFRLAIGGGYLSSRAGSSGDAYSARGWCEMGEMLLGYCPVNNLALHFGFRLDLARNADVEHNGEKLAGNRKEMSVGSSCNGIGATYYADNTGFFLTGVIGFSGINYVNIMKKSKNDTDGRLSGSGSIFYFSIGHEWWLTDEWGVGLSLFYCQASGKSAVDDNYKAAYDLRTRSAGIACTATYN